MVLQVGVVADSGIVTGDSGAVTAHSGERDRFPVKGF